MNIDTFVKHYLITALWAECAEDGTPLDDCFNLCDISPKCLVHAKEDCASFINQAGSLLNDALEFYKENGYSNHPDCDGDDEACIAHDFLLTRNRHGVGFWDRGMPKELGQKLTALAQSFGEVSLYIGDNGKIYS